MQRCLACAEMNGGEGGMNGPRVKPLDILTHVGPNGAQTHTLFVCSYANSGTLPHDKITLLQGV